MKQVLTSISVLVLRSRDRQQLIVSDMAPPGRITRNNSSITAMTIDWKLDFLLSTVLDINLANNRFGQDVLEVKKRY